MPGSRADLRLELVPGKGEGFRAALRRVAEAAAAGRLGGDGRVPRRYRRHPAALHEKLKVLSLLVPFALERRLSYAQLDDLVERALTERLFDLDAATHMFTLYIDQTEATY